MFGMFKKKELKELTPYEQGYLVLTDHKSGKLLILKKREVFAIESDIDLSSFMEPDKIDLANSISFTDHKMRNFVRETAEEIWQIYNGEVQPLIEKSAAKAGE